MKYLKINPNNTTQLTDIQGDYTLDIKQAKQLIKDLSKYINISNHELSLIVQDSTFDNVIHTVASVFELQPSDLLRRTRVGDIKTARQVAIYVLKMLNYGTLEAITKKFEPAIKSSSATALHSINAVKDMIDTKDVIYYELINKVLNVYSEKLFKKM